MRACKYLDSVGYFINSVRNTNRFEDVDLESHIWYQLIFLDMVSISLECDTPLPASESVTIQLEPTLYSEVALKW